MAVQADAIPRYAPPAPGELDGPARTCGSCAHADDLEGTVVCCCERDKVGTIGMLYVVAAASTVTAAAVAVGMRAGAGHGVVAWLLMVAMLAVLWAALLREGE